MSLEEMIAQRVAEEIAAQLPGALAEALRALPPPASRYVSVREAAEVSGYKQQTIRKWLAQGRLHNYGRHGSPRVRLDEILKFGD